MLAGRCVNQEKNLDDASELGGTVSLEDRAAALVNPASGVANDYLNVFNEILLLIENLPVLLPEMVDELLMWHPVSYREYFQNSRLPGSEKVLQIYDGLSDGFRHEFESLISSLDHLALESVKVIAEHRDPSGEINPDEVAEFCEAASAKMRRALVQAADLVNHGLTRPVETPQTMADRILDSAAEH